ncbi:MAG: hypothetical protein M3R69_12200 [Acidobacteriota bacterium]|nr:hypothetical protein [Acidobacteriota bacterium]
MAISKTLANCASSLERVGRWQWNFSLSNGHNISARARIDEQWLLIHAPLAASAGHDAWDLLQLNAQLEGLSKFALLPGRERTYLCAEMPLDEDLDLGARLRETCDGFKAALEVLHDEKAGAGTKLRSSAHSKLAGKNNRGDLRRLCEEAGWNFTEKSEGRLAIDLDVRGGFYQASAEERGTGGVLLSVELARNEFAADECRRALSTVLLRASGAVRLARAAIEKEEDQTLARFEANFVTAPCAAELNHALSALSVACALCGQEAKALQDEFVAKNYIKSLES